MTYQEAETFLNENIETAKYHNRHLVDKLGYKIKDLIIAPENATVETLRDIFIHKQHNGTNEDYLISDKTILNSLDVFIWAAAPMDIFGIIRLTNYLDKDKNDSNKSSL